MRSPFSQHIARKKPVSGTGVLANRKVNCSKAQVNYQLDKGFRKINLPFWLFSFKPSLTDTHLQDARITDSFYDFVQSDRPNQTQV